MDQALPLQMCHAIGHLGEEKTSSYCLGRGADNSKIVQKIWSFFPPKKISKIVQLQIQIFCCIPTYISIIRPRTTYRTEGRGFKSPPGVRVAELLILTCHCAHLRKISASKERDKET
jgi:hypothetical protein